MSDDKKVNPLETLKLNSDFLRGTIKNSLSEETTHFSKDDGSLLKSHGTYEQDDRDKRQTLLAQKQEPAYSMMVRSKIPGGKMTAEQYLVHDELADKYGDHTMRLTTRQGIQFHGVLKKNVKAVIRGINEKLGTTLGACGDNVRNVMTCPAPHADRHKAEILEYAKAVSDQFLHRSGAYQEIWLDGMKCDHLPQPVKGNDPEPIYGKEYLPRKFKFAFAFPEDNCTDIYSNDVGIVPEISSPSPSPLPQGEGKGEGKLLGFNILVGGGFGMTHGVITTYPRLASPLCFVKPEELLAVTKAIVLVQRDHGNRTDRKRARMKYLIDEKGLDWFRAEVEKRFGKKTEPAHAIHWKPYEMHLGWRKAHDGKWYLGISVENGRVKDDGKMRLKTAFRELAKKYKPEVIITAQQDILFSGFQESQKKEVEGFLGSYGVLMPWTLSNIQKDAMACPALPTCGLAITESERALPWIIDEVEKTAARLGLAEQRIIIRMTGCPNACARPYNAEIALVGRTVGTYALYLGGNLEGDRLNFLYRDKVLYKETPSVIEKLLALYKEKRQPAEGFGDFCHRMGAAQLSGLMGV